jgi:hypothetical protein
MGTNYYYTNFKKCDCCGHVDQEEMHVGKSSIGWRFHFDLTAFTDPKNWKEELKNKYLYDEYDREISYNEFLTLVEAKQSTMTNEEVLERYANHPNYGPTFIEGYLKQYEDDEY